jgi:phosphoribosylamine--glycine ligase/phosphoribosylglycinamide formyltransferase/phosphoribosylformylglycinamidine cyclo-ligase/phosphoribosylamine--glycine ligase/phosphoribosylformylglycinamidine cyclo-ligase
MKSTKRCFSFGSDLISILSLFQVLELLTKTAKECGIQEIIPSRSQAMPSALLQPPYRSFLSCSTEEKARSPLSLLLYCLPTNVTEYVGFSSEAESVRSMILSEESSSIVVAAYDAIKNEIVGGSTADVLAAVSGNSEAQASLAAASLTALSELDAAAVRQVVCPSKRKDIVIVVGSGGREHALAVALAKSPLVSEVLCCPGNGGTASESNPKIKNRGANQANDTVIDLVKEVGAKMVVVGPEAPLVAGLVDQLEVVCPEVLCFGPTKAAAELEASKAFTKDFLQEHNIPTAKYRTFTDAEEAIKYVESLDENDRQVVKASGLAAGKGVLIPTSKQETIAAVNEIMSDKAFGNAGDECVIESFLTGPEASCFALCDGKTAVLMPAAQDHKRALDNDEGLNTGGMGAYAPAPCVTPDLQKQIEQMCKTTVEKMAERGTPYVGLLYAGLM